MFFYETVLFKFQIVNVFSTFLSKQRDIIVVFSVEAR